MEQLYRFYGSKIEIIHDKDIEACYAYRRLKLLRSISLTVKEYGHKHKPYSDGLTKSLCCTECKSVFYDRGFYTTYTKHDLSLLNEIESEESGFFINKTCAAPDHLVPDSCTRMRLKRRSKPTCDLNVNIICTHINVSQIELFGLYTLRDDTHHLSNLKSEAMFRRFEAAIDAIQIHRGRAIHSKHNPIYKITGVVLDSRIINTVSNSVGINLSECFEIYPEWFYALNNGVNKDEIKLIL